VASGHVALVRAPNPGPFTGPGTNTWIFGSEESVVIDPGPLIEDHLQAVVRAAEQIGRVVAVICTHHHADHRDGAERLCELTGAPLALFHQQARRADDLPLHHGDRVIAGGTELLVLHTPGHASDHICLLGEAERVLFTGDHILSGTTSVIWPPDGDMTAYLRSLELVRQRQVDRLLPGHGDAIEDPSAAVSALIEHRLERERQILGRIRQGASTPASIVTALYSDYADELWEAAGKTVLAHCLRLVYLGQVSQTGAADSPVFEAVPG